jgi:hypothetical protein
LEDDRAMQYLIEEIREEGSSRVSRKGKVLMASLSPEFEQWKKRIRHMRNRSNLQSKPGSLRIS